jgi:hypothetical protein
MQCCSKRCASENKKGIDFQKIIGKGNCLCCNKEFDIKSNVPQQKFCSNPCKSKYYNNNDINKIKVYCDVCKTEVLRTKSNLNKNQHVFCSKTCEVKFRHDQAYEIRQCEICNKEIECSKLSTQRFCSLACQIEWQQKYPKLGLENKQFTSQLISCHWCGNEYYENQYKVNSEQKNFFCSNKCRREWYSKKFSQSIEWKERSAINATKLLCSGIMSKKETSIQTKINKLLSDMNIKYKNEYNCKYVAIDNAIFVNNKMLFIECMGTYWHCDLRNYTKIQYEMQKNRIRMDKIKHTYIKNTYGIDILYLWETDISKNIELCKELIKQYIQNEGLLLNYHSCNYSIVDKKLTLNKYVIQQYMDWDIDDINKVTDLSVKIKMSRKQEDKWIAFECEYCGKEREELISHYNKHKNHYCSRECSSKGRKILNIKNILK